MYNFWELYYQYFISLVNSGQLEVKKFKLYDSKAKLNLVPICITNLKEAKMQLTNNNPDELAWLIAR